MELGEEDHDQVLGRIDEERRRRGTATVILARRPDNLGRSQIVRLLYGARVSLSVGVGAAFINLTIGLVLGLAAGYSQGWLDDVVQFVINTLISASAADGINRAYQGTPVDFLPTNTFEQVAGCKQSTPQASDGSCPAQVTCP